MLGYDAGLPLGANAQKTLENGTFTRYHVTYLNDRGDTVPGILTLPKTTNGPFQTVFFQHGMGDTKDCNYMLKGTKRFVELGCAVFAIDAMGFGERSTPFPKHTSPVMFFSHPFLLRSVFIQTSVDVRRGVDYLLAFDGEYGSGDLQRNAGLWGIRQVGEYKGARLYRLP